MIADDQALYLNFLQISSGMSDHFSLIIFDNCFAILLKYPYFMSFCVGKLKRVFSLLTKAGWVISSAEWRFPE